MKAVIIQTIRMIRKYSEKVVKQSIRNNVSIIAEWFKTKYNIHNYNDNFFENFLLRCNNDVTLCKQKLTKYILYKKMYSRYLQAGDLNDDIFRKFCSSVFSLYMLKLSSCGYRVFVDKITDDESLFDVFKIIKYYCMLTDLRYLEDGYDSGDVILFDCNHINILKFVAFIPYFVKSLTLLLEIYPLQLKLLVLINTGKVMEILLNIVKRICLRNYRTMIYIYSGGHKNYLNHVGADVLPKDYNGELDTMKDIREAYMRKLENYNEWFAEIDRKINTLRLNELLVTENDTFGILCENTWPNLQID